MGFCFVPGCKGGFNNQPGEGHMFKAPAKSLDQWRQILRKVRADREFGSSISNRGDVLCSEHFEEKYIMKVDRYVINGETVEMPRKKWTLAPGAIPTIFNCVPLSIRPRVSKPRRKLVRKMVEPEVKRKVQSQVPFLVRNYKADTKGKCFMCLNLIEDTNNSQLQPVRKRKTYRKADTSNFCLTKVASYLEVNFKKIFNPTGLQQVGKAPELRVSLCSNCTANTEALIEMLKELEQIQNRVDASIREMGRLMEGSKGAADGNQRDDERPEATLADKLRVQFVYKCASQEVQCTSRYLPPPSHQESITQTVNHLETSIESQTVSRQSTSTGEEIEILKQEVEFRYQFEGDEWRATDEIGRFKDEDLFQFLRKDIDMDLDMNDDMPLPASPDLHESQGSTGLSEVAENKKFPCTFNLCQRVFASASQVKRHLRMYHSDVNRPTKKPQSVPVPDLRTKLKCPYCSTSFALECNIRIHILHKHRFKVFQKYLPAGTEKSLVLSELKDILNQNKTLEGEGGNQIGCNYCPRKFTKKDVELLVDQNHALINHFNEVVSRLKRNITRKTRGAAVKSEPEDINIEEIEIQSDSESVTEVTPHPSQAMISNSKDDDDDDILVVDVLPKRIKT